MTLKALQEMIELNEAPMPGAGLVASFKKGFNDTKNAHDTRSAEIDKAANKAAKAAADVEKAKAATEKAKLAADKAKEVAKKRTDAAKKMQKVDLEAIHDDVAEFLDNFFTQFPSYNGVEDSGGANDLAEKYSDKASLHALFTAYKNVAARVESLRSGMNASLRARKKISADQLTKFNHQARVFAGSNAPPTPAALISFVKKEAAFFKRMIRITNTGELDEVDFKQILTLKMNQTDTARIPDAAQALNMLFGFMTSVFSAHARAIAEAAKVLDDNERKERVAKRNAPPPEPEQEQSPTQEGPAAT